MDAEPRTLMISPYFDATLPGGGVLYSINVAREWLRRGRRVAVLCSTGTRELGDLEAYLQDDQLTLCPIVTPEQIRFTHHLHPAVGAAAQWVIDEFQPDVIHVHNFQGMLDAVEAAIASPAPVILTALDMGLLCLNFCLYNGTVEPCDGPTDTAKCARCVRQGFRGLGGHLGPRLPGWLTRLLWPRFVRLDQIQRMDEIQDAMVRIRRSLDAIVTLSPIVARKLREFGTPPERIVPIDHSVPAERMVRPPKRESSTVRLAYLGGTEPVKGLGVLLATVEHLPDDLPLEIRFYGSDSLRQRLESASPAVHRYARYHPPVFGRELGEEHAHIDAVLVPSICHENSPYVVLEALANGTAVIASDQAGIRHLIAEDETGWLIPPGDLQAWSEALQRAARRPAHLARMQQNAMFSRMTREFVEDLCRLERRCLAGRGAVGTVLQAQVSSASDPAADSEGEPDSKRKHDVVISARQ